MQVSKKIRKGMDFVKLRWSTPAPGEKTNLKEFMSYCIGTLGICGFTFVCSEMVAFTAGYFCGSIMEIKLMDFTIITFIALVVKYATLYIESINMTIFENLGHLTSSKAKKAAATYIICTVVGIAFYFVPSAPFDSIIKGLPGIIGNTLTVMGAGGLVNWYLRGKLCKKYGRYKPFMMIYGIPVTLITIAITFVPTTLDYTVKLVLLHFLFTLRGRFTSIYCDNPTAIVALITPNMVERQKYYSIGGIFTGNLRSIFRIIFPILIVSTGGYLAVESYRVFIPILSVISLLIGLTFVKVKERVAVNQVEMPKIDFKKSAKSLFENKYFWIINLANTFALWNGLADGVINYIFIYQLRMEWIVGVISIIGVTSAVGNILTPWLIKRFEKRTCILVMRSVWIAMIALYPVALKLRSVAMLMVIIFIRSAISAACNGITTNMGADVLDYHQWKTGERADNMQTIFAWFTTPVATVLGLVSPWLLEQFGYTSDWDVLFDTSIFYNVMYVYVFLTIGGLVISTIPYLFYNFTKAQHDKCVEEIRLREAAAQPVLTQEVAE